MTQRPRPYRVVDPRYDIQNGVFVASLVLGGHLYIVTLDLAPHVAARPVLYPEAMRTARVKAARELADMINQVLNETAVNRRI